MGSVRRSIVFSGVERYGSLLLLVGSTAVLARLLTPAEIGASAVVNAIVTVIAASFQEFGGANFLIQKRELARRSIRTAFTIMFCLSAATAAVLVFSGELIA